MTMGIVVDDTVHFLSKYLRARREKSLAAPDAIRYAFSSVGRALWVTSAVLVAGFIVLAQSTFKQNSDMGCSRRSPSSSPWSPTSSSYPACCCSSIVRQPDEATEELATGKPVLTQ